MITKRARGAKTMRTETISVRMEPKLRYLAEIAARTHRRSLSSFVEWAVEDALSRAQFRAEQSVAQAADSIWDVDEPDRFVKLALYAPRLLNYDEQRLWKAIREHAPVWNGEEVNFQEESPASILQHINFVNLREAWPALKTETSGV